jgi:hypothetical protein
MRNSILEPKIVAVKSTVDQLQNSNQTFMVETADENFSENNNKANGEKDHQQIPKANVEFSEELADRKHNTTNKDSSRNKKNDRIGKNSNQNQNQNQNVEFGEEFAKKNNSNNEQSANIKTEARKDNNQKKTK